jgi:hypothetical protein
VGPRPRDRVLRCLSIALLVSGGGGCGPGTPRFEQPIEPLLGTIWAELVLHPGDPGGVRWMGSTQVDCPALDPASPRVAVRVISEIPAVAATLSEASVTPGWAIHIVPPDVSLASPVWSWAGTWASRDAPDEYRAQLLFAPGAAQPWIEVGTPLPVALSRGINPRIGFDRPGLWTLVELPAASPPTSP